MISAGTTFTNDRYPRATHHRPRRTAPVRARRAHPAHPGRRAATTIGARATIGPGIELGRFSMIGMGAVVTRSVPDFHLVAGQPARTVGAVCRCGEPFAARRRRRPARRASTPRARSAASAIGIADGVVTELEPV